MHEGILDSVIIGGGPAGISVANCFQKNNVNYLLLERKFIGSNIARFPVSMTFFSDRRLLEIDDFPMAIPEEKPDREQYLTYLFHFARSRKLRIHDNTVVLKIETQKENNLGVFRIAATDHQENATSYLARSVVMACGAFDHPRLLNVPGEDLHHVSHYFTEVFPYLNHKVLVIGSGNSAVETALKLYRAGCEVTLSYRGKSLSDKKIKYWLYPDIKKRFEKKEIMEVPDAVVTRIAPGRVYLRNSEMLEIQAEADFVLVLTGYNPPVDFLKSNHIELTEITNVPVHNPATLETPVKGLFVAGVITGGNISGKVFIENSRDHGEIILPRLREILK